MSQCTATSKRSGQQCRRTAMIGKAVCMMHGGKTPTGIALPQFKHGRYSKVLPARLLERYEAAQADPDRLHLDAEIALLDTRLSEVLSDLSTEDTAARWSALRLAWAEVQQVLANPDAPPLALRVALRAVDRLLSAPYASDTVWTEVQELVQARRKLVESERKHQVEAQQMIRLDAVMTLLTAMAVAVKDHVTDPLALQAISATYARLTAGVGVTAPVVDSTARPADG